MDIKVQSRKKLPLIYLWLPLVLIAIGFGVVKAKNYVGDATAFVDTSKIRVSKVQQGNFQINVRGVGMLKPKKVLWLSSRVAGRVEQISKHAGAQVLKGDAIVRLSNPQLEQSVLAAQSSLKQLKAEHKAAEASLDSQILDAEAALAKSQMDYEGYKRELDAQSRLRKMGNSTVSDLDYQRSAFKVKSAKLEWDIQTKKLANLKVNVAALKQAHRAKQSHLQSELARARQQVADLVVRAQEDGVLQSMALELGQEVAIGGSVGKIADTSQLMAQIDIQELQIKDVEIGQQVVIDTRKSQISGTVSRIDPQVLKGLVAVEVTLLGELPGEARPELSVEGIIQITNKDNALFVKKPHYAQDYKTAKVFRLNAAGNLADAVEVEFGQSSVNTIEITSGLRSGDRIIVSKTDSFAQNAQVLLR